MTKPSQPDKDSITPIPWRIGFSDGSGAFQYEEEGASITAEGNQVIVSGGQDQGVPVGVRKIADADFIVRAANNHAKLLKALERLADTMSDYPLGRATGSDVADAIGDARAVIEEAKS